MVKSILFVCTGNTCRSVMAEGLLRHYAELADLDLDIASAGIRAFPGDEASQYTIEVLGEVGIDVSGHRARKVSPYLLAEYDLILPMTTGHEYHLRQLVPDLTEKVFLLKEFVERNTFPKQDPDDLIEKDYEISDPFGGSLEIYRQSREEIKREIEALVNLLIRGNE